MMSDTIIVAIITACATTIPNIVIAIINNKFQYKSKKFEVYELTKRDALIEFNKIASQYFSTNLTRHSLIMRKH